MSASKRVKALLGKEWAELFHSRMLMFTVVGVPLIFLAVATVNMFTVAALPPDPKGDPLPAYMLDMCGGVDGIQCVQIYLSSVFHLLFLMTPMVIPSAIAAYGVVGEKNARTLEPLLATPITVAELVFAKTVAPVVPGVLATWVAYSLWMLIGFLAMPHAVFTHMLTGPWALAIVITAPLMALLSTLVGLMVSSRSTDPRAAQQVAGLVVLPLVGLMFGQLSGFLLVSIPLVLALSGTLVLLDAALLWLAVQVFEREAILTRWK